MKALLTGITGNLGYDVALELARRSFSIIPCVRPGKKEEVSSLPLQFEEILEWDLVADKIVDYSGKIDCIVHCAGIVHFRNAGNKNEQMMRNIISLAKRLSIPVHFASTAFVYRPDGTDTSFTNGYEQDKFNAEEALRASGLTYSVLRPSVLTGNSQTGKLRNYSGYYIIVKAFIAAAKAAQAHGRNLRFPKMTGLSDIIPVDQVAERIGDIVERQRYTTLYLTNPAPPLADWVLRETLDFFNLQNVVQISDTDFQEFGSLSLSEEEHALYEFAKNFNTYWSMNYRFPESDCAKTPIDSAYLKRTLTAFAETMNKSHA